MSEESHPDLAQRTNESIPVKNVSINIAGWFECLERTTTGNTNRYRKRERGTPPKGKRNTTIKEY